MKLHALISIHDVMPHTLNRVVAILALLAHLDKRRITLLVVPGRHWTDTQLGVLHDLQSRGFLLAGHGWHHRTRHVSGLYHRLHAAILSRNVAEHLALNETEIGTLLDECHQWFVAGGFEPPDLYVPPAWAMGKIGESRLQQSPFRYFENTAGFYDSELARQRNLPLIGFEADNLFRAAGLTLWNRFNAALSSPTRPLRISIHPDDSTLHLKHALRAYLSRIVSQTDHRSIW